MMSASTSVPRSAPAPARSRLPNACSSTSATKERLKKIAEARAAEFELDTAAVRASPTLEAAARLSCTAPSGRGLEASGLIPICAQLIVFPALLRIAQDFVGFVNLFELFLRSHFVLGDIRMVFARELTEGGLGFHFPSRSSKRPASRNNLEIGLPSGGRSFSAGTALRNSIRRSNAWKPAKVLLSALPATILPNAGNRETARRLRSCRGAHRRGALDGRGWRMVGTFAGRYPH